MIKGKQLTFKVEKPDINYRKLDALNQSMLKVFDENPVKFFEEFKLGKKRKEKVSTALTIGDLVDFYLLSCKGDDLEFENRFDEKFALLDGSKGQGQVFLLADYLFEETENCRDASGEITCSFETRFSAAVARIKSEDKYKGKDEEKILEDFLKNGKDYFDTRLENLGKLVVDVSLVDKAKTIGKKMINDDFTKLIFRGNNMSEYHQHFPILWEYSLNDTQKITCKCEVDMLFIDHKKKIIQPMDLKTTYDNESFEYNYIKNGYYIQNSFYFKAVEFWADTNGFGDYEVRPMKFVVGDTSANNRRPLVYETSEGDIIKGLSGFKLRGLYHRGVDELIQDIAWAEINNEWTCSKEAFDNKGKILLDIQYES